MLIPSSRARSARASSSVNVVRVDAIPGCYQFTMHTMHASTGLRRPSGGARIATLRRVPRKPRRALCEEALDAEFEDPPHAALLGKDDECQWIAVPPSAAGSRSTSPT